MAYIDLERTHANRKRVTIAEEDHIRHTFWNAVTMFCFMAIGAALGLAWLLDNADVNRAWAWLGGH